MSHSIVIPSPAHEPNPKGLVEQQLTHLSPEQLDQFANEIGAVGKRAIEELGNEKDEHYLRRLKSSNLSCEALGRTLIHFSFEPFSYFLGILLLSIHFNLEVTFAHNAGHGAFNRLRKKKGLEQYSSKEYKAKNLPASIEGWKYVHNKLHHIHCNIIGKDPDVGYELFRVSELQGKPAAYQRFQVGIILLLSLPIFLVTGFRTYEYLAVKENEEKKASTLLKKLLTGTRYFFTNLVLFPLLAGVFFLSTGQFIKVLVGNLLAEAFRGLSYGTMFHMGHHTGTVKFYPENTLPANKAEWYIQQIETSHSVKINSPIKHMFGGLDLQIEHHLFPNLPPNKLYEIQPEVEKICSKYGIHYSTAGFFKSALLCLKNYAKHSKHD